MSRSKPERPPSVYHRHPIVFRAAHPRLQPQPTPNFVEFYGDRSAALTKEGMERRVAVLTHALSAHFEARNHTKFCRVLIEEPGREITFLIIRGGTPHATGCVHDWQCRLMTFVPEQHDIVLYDPETDRLSICTPFPADQRHYQATMGFVLAHDDAYFRALPIFHGEPMRERGSAALDSSGIGRLGRVILRRITLLGRDELDSTVHFAADDLTASLDDGPLHTILRQRSIGAWTFGVATGQNAAPREVDVLPPNQLRFDRRVPLGAFREFMARQGFLQVPARR